MAGAFEGILPRRAIAYLFDLAFIAVLGTVLSVVLMILTVISLGLLGGLWYALPLLAIAYHTVLIGGRHASTWGMRVLDIEVASTLATRPTYAQAFVMAVVFYVTTLSTSYLILLVPLFTHRHRAVHDMLSGTVVLRHGYVRDTSSLA
ncbi:MAG TPA: RDD family protein [Stellaceae bacterium]|nr:RDD family protein [Stellaceae bacterium]